MADVFQPKFFDLVRNLTTTTGTGNFVLGPAINGYTSFTAACQVGDRFYYSAIGLDRPSEREVGRGTLLAGGAISREPVGGVLTNFSNGSKTVALIAAAEWYSRLEAGPGAANRGALATASSAQTAVMLAERGREGLFVWEGSDLSANVAADAAQGLFVARAGDPTGASGAWVRKFSGSVNVSWFGATGDGVTDESGAFLAALAALKAIAVNNDGDMYKGSPGLFIPAGLYNLRATTLDVTHTLIIEGESSINGYGSRLKWTGDCDGIRVQGSNTSGSATADGPHFSGSYTIIRNLGLAGPQANVNDFTGRSEGEFHGINARSNVIIEDVLIDGFAGDGIHANCSVGAGGAGEGNANCSFVSRVKVTNVRNGLFIDGSDTNAWVCSGIVGIYCRRWTVWDSSFLGNTHIGHHSANAGLIKGVAPAIVSYAGKRYAVIARQEDGARTNAPSGTATDNEWWLYLGDGPADAGLNIPAWASGITLRASGCYCADGLNAYNSFIGCYNEGGEGPAQFVKPTVTLGGTWGTRDPATSGNYFAGGELALPNPIALGPTRVADSSTARVLSVHNNGPLASTIPVRLNFEQGYEADGATPANLASIYAYGSSATPSVAEAKIAFATRTYGGTGGMTDRVIIDGQNLLMGPAADNGMDLGYPAGRWKTAYAYTADFSSAVKIGGNQVLGPRGASLPGDASDLPSAIALVNAIKARLKTTGGHGLVAD